MTADGDAPAARNLPDRAVQALFAGERHLVEECTEWNRHSQPPAQVTPVDVEWGTPTGQSRRFAIRR